MEEPQERAVLERGLKGSGGSLSREEQGKNKGKIVVFFWSQPVGECRQQDTDQLPGWAEDGHRMPGHRGSVQPQEISSLLLFSLLLRVQNEALGDPWGAEQE